MSYCLSYRKRRFWRTVFFALSLLITLSRAVDAQTGYKFLRTFATGTHQWSDIAVGPDGLLYLASFSSISRFKKSGELVDTISELQVQGLVRNFAPTTLKFDSSGILHVLDDSGVIFSFRDGALLSNVNIGDPETDSFSDMAMDSAGNYYVYNLSGDVSKFGPSCEFLFTIPKIPDAAPMGSALAMSARDELHVLRHTNGEDTVEVFSSAGTHLRRLKLPDIFYTYSLFNIFSDPKGNIIVNATGVNDVFRHNLLITFSPEGRNLKIDVGEWADFEYLSGIVFDASGRLYTAKAFEIGPILVYAPAPNAKIFFSLLPEKLSQQTVAEFKFGTDKKKDRFQCSLDGRPFKTCSGTKRYTNLSRGAHTFKVRVHGNSRSGRTETWTVRFTSAPTEKFFHL